MGIAMTLNGYVYHYPKSTPCEDCGRHHKKATNKGKVYFSLWEYKGKKLCRECVRGKGVL